MPPRTQSNLAAPITEAAGTSPSQDVSSVAEPPLYFPFRQAGKFLIPWVSKFPPNALTSLWILLEILAAALLLRGFRYIPAILILISIIIDCLDGDVARSTKRTSRIGSLLENFGHWLATPLTAGALAANYASAAPRGVAVVWTLLLTTSTVALIVATTYVERFSETIAANQNANALRKAINAVYNLMPLEVAICCTILILPKHLVSLLPLFTLSCVGATALLVVVAFALRLNNQSVSPASFPSNAQKAGDDMADAIKTILPLVPGPSRVPECALRALGTQPLYHRSSAFESLWQCLRDELCEIFQTSGAVIPLTSSGTGAMEAAALNLISKGENVAVINTGPFSERWAQICERIGADVYRFEVDFGKQPDFPRLKQFLHELPACRAVLATLAESSHGGAVSVKHLRELVPSKDTLICVDAITGLLADELNMDAWDIDVALGVSQKGLMSPPGIALVALSKRAVMEVIHRSSNMQSLYWDLQRYMASPASPPFTPATSLLSALHITVRMIRTAGVARIIAHRRLFAEALRSGLRMLDFNIVAENPSNACTTVTVPHDLSADVLIKGLRDTFAIQVASGRTPEGLPLLRVGNTGWLFREHIVGLLNGLSTVMETAMYTKPSETAVTHEGTIPGRSQTV